MNADPQPWHQHIVVGTSVVTMWDNILLTVSTISGYNWTALTDVATANSFCSAAPCVNGGHCLALVGGAAAAGACSCPAGYTSPTCGQPTTACSQAPCLNGALCQDDPTSGEWHPCRRLATSFLPGVREGCFFFLRLFNSAQWTLTLFRVTCETVLLESSKFSCLFRQLFTSMLIPRGHPQCGSRSTLSVLVLLLSDIGS